MQILVSKRICGSSRTDYPKFVAFREQISGFTLMLDVPVTRDLAFSFGEDPLSHPGKTHIRRLTGSRGCALLLWSARPPHTPKFRTCRPPGGWATSVILLGLQGAMGRHFGKSFQVFKFKFKKATGELSGAARDKNENHSPASPCGG